ncbi:MAG: hypothetical protein FWB91_07575 [Defluviitaleaceae bacterium]|nr:hypothetical protein [Defluviitaleaceae bacterium]
MPKRTDELSFELETSKNIHKYMETNEAEFDDKNFYSFLSVLISDSGKPKTRIVADSCISEPYLYNLLRGEKRPTRNSVIKLAFGLGLTLETTERLLMLAGHSSFYVRHKRDALLKHALQNNMTICEADNLLVGYGFSVMTE